MYHFAPWTMLHNQPYYPMNHISCEPYCPMNYIAPCTMSPHQSWYTIDHMTPCRTISIREPWHAINPVAWTITAANHINSWILYIAPWTMSPHEPWCVVTHLPYCPWTIPISHEPQYAVNHSTRWTMSPHEPWYVAKHITPGTIRVLPHGPYCRMNP